MSENTWYVAYAETRVMRPTGATKGPGLHLKNFPNEEGAQELALQVRKKGFVVYDAGTLEGIEPAIKIKKHEIDKWCGLDSR